MALLNAGVISQPASVQNLQSNGIVERAHQSIAQIVCTHVASNPLMKEEDAVNIAEDAFATAVHACCCAASLQLDCASPGSIAFGRDMMLSIPFMVDFVTLQKN